MSEQTKISKEVLLSIGFSECSTHLHRTESLGYWGMSFYIANATVDNKLPYVYVSNDIRSDDIKIQFIGYGGDNHVRTIKHIFDVLAYIRDISFMVGKAEQSNRIMELLTYSL